VKREDLLKHVSPGHEEGKGNGHKEKELLSESHAHENLESPTAYPVFLARPYDPISVKEGVNDRRDILYLAASELLDNIELARVGIGFLLTYAMYQFSQRPALQSTLRDELMKLTPTLKYPPRQEALSTSTLQQLDGLALIDSIVMETLRVHTPAPSPQRRLVPEGGAVVEGYVILTGVTIHSSPNCSHWYEGAYPDANTWRPKGWMETRRNEDSGELSKDKAVDDPRRVVLGIWKWRENVHWK
jgi:hypothetical protein